MRRTVTLVIDEAYEALARAAIVGASCPCGQPAARVVIERDPYTQPKVKAYRDTERVLGDEGIHVRSWCGVANDEHIEGRSTSRYGADLDMSALALVEEDL